MWRVFAFYPHLKLKIRGTEYDRYVEMLEYVNALNMCATPYFVLCDGKMVECRSFDMGTEEMAEMVEKYL